uniref:Uncharacterized protein n=1 Tax=Oryza nivara TaxID=4536 RepID=A0A0E0FJ04_ORYNI
MAAAAVGVASRARRSSGPRGVAFCRWTNGLLHPRFVFPEAAAWVLRMVLNKVLELFCVKKKDSKKKVAAPHPTANVSTNNSLLDPFSSGNGTVLSVQKHEPECSSVISSMTRTEYGFESDGCNSFSHFDVQDFSDHYYAKNSPGKLDACAHPFFDELREPNAHLPWQMVVHSLLCSTSSMK